MHQVRTCRKRSLVFPHEKRGDARLARQRLIHTWLFMRTRENRGCASDAQVNKHIPTTTPGEKGRAPRITGAALPKSTQKCYSFSSRGIVPSPRFRVSARSCGFGAPSSVVLLVMQPNKSVRRSILRLTSCLPREILRKASQLGGKTRSQSVEHFLGPRACRETEWSRFRLCLRVGRPRYFRVALIFHLAAARCVDLLCRNVTFYPSV